MLKNIKKVFCGWLFFLFGFMYGISDCNVICINLEKLSL